MKKYYGRLVIIVFVLSIPPLFPFYKGLIKSAHSLFRDSNFIEGILLPIPNQNNQKYIIDLGEKSVVPYQYLKTGNQSWVPIFACQKPTDKTDNSDTPCDLKLKLNDDNTLVISVTVRDYKSGAIIGRIVENHWEIKPSKIYDYDDSSDHLEILDEYGNVAFRLLVDKNNVIRIRGYFIGRYCGFILCNGYLLMTDNKDEQVKGISSTQVLFCKHFRKTI